MNDAYKLESELTIKLIVEYWILVKIDFIMNLVETLSQLNNVWEFCASQCLPMWSLFLNELDRIFALEFPKRLVNNL